MCIRVTRSRGATWTRVLPGLAWALALPCLSTVKHIVIADDDCGMLRLMARTLPDYRVTVTRNGVEALAVATALTTFDLLITDYMMTPMLGDELTGRLRSLRPEVKTLLVTSHADHIDVGEFGADAKLAKPFGVAALRGAVSSLIGEA